MSEVKELHKSSEYNKKITKSWNMDDYEILTDDGYIGLESLHQTIEYDVYELKTKKGKSLRCADNHIVFNSIKEEIFVKDLKKGDLIITDDGDDIVISVTNLGYKEEMYDFQLENNSNRRYFTNGVLSHNTELARVLAEYLFDDRDSIIRVDMSEYMEKFSISRLVGAPPGYVGYEEGGQLTEKVRRKPYSVILLDEIEKAHPDIFNLLLQALDDGHMTDGNGRKINFKNTIIIMTSNIGSRKLQDFGTGIGFNTKTKVQSRSIEQELIIKDALKKTFAPEFLNRIDEVIVFDSLTKENINEIVKLELELLYNRIEELGFSISLTKGAIDYIAHKGYDEKFGARPLKRAIQKLIENPLTERIIKGETKTGDKVKITYSKKTEELIFK